MLNWSGLEPAKKFAQHDKYAAMRGNEVIGMQNMRVRVRSTSARTSGVDDRAPPIRVASRLKDGDAGAHSRQERHQQQPHPNQVPLHAREEEGRLQPRV